MSAAALAALRVVRGPLRAGAPLDALDVAEAQAPLPAADLLSGGGGWLDRLTDLAGAPFALDLYAAGGRGPGWRELDAFALATVYGQVLWDDRGPGWHADSGRPDSAARLREIHDLALRCYRALDAGERLVLVLEEPSEKGSP